MILLLERGKLLAEGAGAASDSRATRRPHRARAATE